MLRMNQNERWNIAPVDKWELCSGLGNGCFLVQYKYVQMMHISKAHQINRATKKNLLLFIESWLFNRDPYFMIYEIIPT